VNRGPAALCGVILLAATSARADDRALVLVAGRGGAAFANRLRAEAAQVGIVVVSDAEASLDEDPSSVCQRNQAVGLIRVWSDTKVALFLPTPPTPPTPGRWSAPVETFQASADDRDSLALRIIEEVRSRLAATPQAPPPRAEAPTPPQVPPPEGQGTAATPPQVARAPAPPPADAPNIAAALTAPPAQTPAAAPTSLSLGLSGGVAGTFSPGRLGTALQAAVAITARRSSGFGLALRGAFPLLAEDVNAPEGAVRWRPVLATVEAVAEPWRRPGWSVVVGAEGGAMFLNVSPSAAPDYVGHPDRMVVAVFLAGVGVRAPLTDWLAARAGLSVGVATPRPVLRIDGRDAAHWGRPCVFLTLTTEARLFELARGATQP